MRGALLLLLGLGCACGAEPRAAAPRHGEGALRGAEVCSDDEALATVAIIGARDDGVAFTYCTGTLITPDVVLVAAHCITETNTVSQWVSRERDLRALPAATVEERDAVLAASVPVRRALAHPEYDGGSHAHDVGLFFLDAALPDAPLGLVLEAGDDAAIGDGDGVTGQLGGYGYDEDEVFGLLRCAPMTVTSGNGVHLYVESEAGGPQGCNGDSGGGLVVAVPTTHARTDRVVGVASYTTPDCAEFTGFADLRLDRAWMATQLDDCSTRAWCEVPGLLGAAFFDPPPLAEGEGEGDPGAPDDDDETGEPPAGCAEAPTPLGALVLALALRRRRARRPAWAGP